MWRIEAEDGSAFYEVGPHGPDGDPDTVAAVGGMLGRPVSMGPGLGAYEPTSRADPAWLWFAASVAIPTPHRTTGTPPAYNPPRAEYPTDAVF